MWHLQCTADKACVHLVTHNPVVGKPRSAALSLNEVGYLKPIWDEFTQGGFLGFDSEKLGDQNTPEWALPLLMIGLKIGPKLEVWSLKLGGVPIFLTT